MFSAEETVALVPLEARAHAAGPAVGEGRAILIRVAPSITNRFTNLQSAIIMLMKKEMNASNTYDRTVLYMVKK